MLGAEDVRGGAGLAGQSEAADRLQTGVGCVVKQLSRC